MDNDKNPERKLALVALELHRLNVDIATLSEIRLADQGQLIEENGHHTYRYTFF
jgi:hypothetical protein